MKNVVGILLLITIFILSGCITGNENNKEDNDIQQNIDNNITSDIVINNTNKDIGNTTETNRSKVNIYLDIKNEKNDTEFWWCISGNKIVVEQREFIIVGVTNYIDGNGVHEDVCKAERITESENSIIYFNEGYIKKDGNQLFAIKSFSVGNNSSVNVSTSISIIGKRK